MHLTCLSFRYFHCVPFDKKLACITNYREKQSLRIRLSRRHFRWHFRRQFVSNQNLQCNGELFLLLNKLFGTSTKRSHPVLLFMLAPSPLCVVDSSFSPHLLCGSAYHYMLIHCNYLEEGSGTKLFRLTLLPDFGEYTWKFCLKLRPEKTWLFHLHRVEASLLHSTFFPSKTKHETNRP